MMRNNIIFALPFFFLIAVIIGVAWRSKPNSMQAETSATPSPVISAEKTVLASKNITGVAPHYQFTAETPPHWQAEAVSEIEAINIFDPTNSGVSNLEKSQIFIRSFTANQFLTLSTVTIHDRQEKTVAGRPAVQYIIEKKPGVASFPHQPSWRNLRHTVTDIRVSDTNPSVFYVIAKRPDLNEATYQHFLQTLKVGESVAVREPIEPVGEFKNRITKKPYGIYITPATSPVQPERFTGYHTGVDVEYGDVPDEVPVSAIANGEVIVSRIATGYGGVLIIRHSIGGKNILALYGHLDPKSMAKVGAKPSAGDQIGILGDGASSETDGERKHLHFAMIKGDAVDLRGYVQTKDALTNWYNPLDFYETP